MYTFLLLFAQIVAKWGRKRETNTGKGKILRARRILSDISSWMNAILVLCCCKTLQGSSFFFFSALLLGSSVAGGDLHFPIAFFALDEATPVELASTPLHPPLPPGGEAAIAAHQLASVDSFAPLRTEKVETSGRKLTFFLPPSGSFKGRGGKEKMALALIVSANERAICNNSSHFQFGFP